MIYIDIELDDGLFEVNDGVVIKLFPSGSIENKKEIDFPFLYDAPSKNDVEEFKKNFHLNLVSWIKKLNPDLAISAIYFCTDHIARHFSHQYCSAFKIAKNISNFFDDETLLVRESFGVISGDWNSSIINFIAVLNAYSEINKNIKIAEYPAGLLSSVLKNGFKYFPDEVLYKNLKNTDEILTFLLEKLSKSEIVKYSITGRNQDFVGDDCFEIKAKSFELNDDSAGISFQFSEKSNAGLPFVSPSLFSNNELALIFENLFYRCIFEKILLPVISVEKSFFESIKLNKKVLTAYIEEVSDLESLGLISALKRSNSSIVLTQHSKNPCLSSIMDFSEISDEDILPKFIVANNNYSFDAYQKFFSEKNVGVLKNYGSNKKIEFGKKSNFDNSFILILENDSITNFGVCFNVENLIRDISSFILICIKNGHKNFIWRQRTLKNVALMNSIKNIFANFDINIIPNCFTPVEELAEICFVAVGFGSTSSLSVDLLKTGIPYFFASSEISDNEYVDVNFIDDFGPIASCYKIQEIKKSKKNFQEFLENQINKVNKIYQC